MTPLDKFKQSQEFTDYKLIECHLECGDLGDLPALLYIDYFTELEGRSLLVVKNKWRVFALIPDPIDATELISEYVIDDVLDEHLELTR